MRVNRNTLIFAAKRLYWTAFGVYLVSLVTRIFLPILIHAVDPNEVSSPLGKTLTFIFMELQQLASPTVVAVCLVAAFILHPSVSSRLVSEELDAAHNESLD